MTMIRCRSQAKRSCEERRRYVVMSFYVVNRSVPGYLAEREPSVVLGLEAARAGACSLVAEELEALSEEAFDSSASYGDARLALQRLETEASDFGSEGAVLYGDDGSALGFVITVVLVSAADAFEAAGCGDEGLDVLGEWVDEAFTGEGWQEKARLALGDVRMSDRQRGFVISESALRREREAAREASARAAGEYRTAPLAARLRAAGWAAAEQAQRFRTVGQEQAAQALLDARADLLAFAEQADEETEALKATRALLASEGAGLAAELAEARSLADRLSRVTSACEQAARSLRSAQ